MENVVLLSSTIWKKRGRIPGWLICVFGFFPRTPLRDVTEKEVPSPAKIKCLLKKIIKKLFFPCQSLLNINNNKNIFHTDSFWLKKTCSLNVSQLQF